MNSKSCIICGSKSIEFFSELRDFRLNDKKNKFQYYRCKKCGLIFQYPQLSFEQMNIYYDQNSPLNNIPTRGIKKYLLEYGFKKRAKVILNLQKKGYLLDIGCGSGDFVIFMSNHSKFNISCTEINHASVYQLKHSNGINAKQGILEEIHFSTDQFNIITMWDVIEHIQNPNEILSEIRRILKPNGYLIIRIPNGNSLDFKLFGKYWAGLDAPRHYYVFTNDAIMKLLSNNYFKVKSKQTNIGGYLNFVNSLSFWFTDIKLRSNKKVFILDNLRKIIPQILFFPIIWIKNHLFQGTSITIVAQLKNTQK